MFAYSGASSITNLIALPSGLYRFRNEVDLMTNRGLFSNGPWLRELAYAFSLVFLLSAAHARAELSDSTVHALANAAAVPGTDAFQSAVITAIAEQPWYFSIIVDQAKEVAPEKMAAIIPVIQRAFPYFIPEKPVVAQQLTSSRVPAEKLDGTVLTTNINTVNEIRQWSGELELGGSVVSGNTNTEIINAAFQVSHSRGRWHENINASFDVAREDSETFSRRLFADTETRYFLNDIFLFTFLSAESDRFSAFDYQLSQTVGIGYELIKTAGFQMDLEIGPGARQSSLSDTGKTEIEYTGRLVNAFRWKISDVQEFSLKTAATIGDARTLLETKTSYTGDMGANFGLRLSAEVRHNTDVPGDARKTETISRVTLVYRFGE